MYLKIFVPDIFKYTRNTGTRVHTYKLSIPLYRKDVKKRSFAVRYTNIRNLILVEAVTSNNVDIHGTT